MVYFDSLLSFLAVWLVPHAEFYFMASLTRVLRLGAYFKHDSVIVFGVNNPRISYPQRQQKTHVYSHFPYFKRIKQRHYVHTFTSHPSHFYITLTYKISSTPHDFYTLHHKIAMKAAHKKRRHTRKRCVQLLGHVFVGVLVLLVPLQVFSVNQRFDAALDHLRREITNIKCQENV